MNRTLCKEERLRGKRSISDLFAAGNAFFLWPYKVFWKKIAAAEPYPSRFAVSVPKRRFKHAVKRNLLKRRTREVFRTNKQLLNEAVPEGRQIILMTVYAADRILPTSILEAAMQKILQHIARQHAEPL